jgi:neutral trehalase
LVGHHTKYYYGLLKYNYKEKAQEMVYRWLWLITKNAVEYNGTIPEKFDLEISSHKVLLNMEMWGQNLIISQKKVLVG